jgi:hypothetical protein
MDGHSYLDVEALAQITNGSVRIEPNQVVLTIPNTNFDANTAQPTPALTKDFASAAIATLAEMKEWRGAMGAMVTVAASTNSDHNALQLLNTQYANLAKWESMVVAERQNHNGARTVAANSLRDDPVLIKFSSCGRFLSTMLGSGIFADNPNCD